MTFDQYLAAFALGKVLSSDLPEVGVQALREGYDSVDLAALAGSTSRYDSPRELEEMFMRGLRHLNKAIPGRAEAGRVLRDYYATLVANGAMAPREGAAKIVRLSHELGDVLPSKDYAGDGLGVEKLLGLFYSHDDVEHGDEQSHREIDDDIKKACQQLVGLGPE
jgi:hypothetical protein